MLHITLTPATVPGHEGLEGRRRLFKGPTEGGRQVHTPTGTAQKRGLHNIVAHHVPAEGLTPRQNGQAAALGEGGRPNNGVMAPIAGFRSRPPGQTRTGDPAVEPHPKLLRALIEGLARDDRRRGLDQADIGLALHGVDEMHQGFARHGAVGVQDHHGLVGGTVILHPVGNIAGLTLGVLVPTPIKGPAVGGHPEGLEGDPFCGRGVILGRVRQNKNVKGAGSVQLGQ